MSKYLTAAVVSFLWFSFALTARAQSTSSISGYVTDPSGAAIPSASVMVTNPAVGFTRSLRANELGYYAASALNPGVYSVEVGAHGFKSLRKTDIKLDVDHSIDVNVTLEVGSETQTVTVTAPTVHLDTDNGQRGTIIGSTEIDDLGVNGRNFGALTTLLPGVTGSVGTDIGAVVANGIEINGSRGWANSWSVDNTQDLEPKSNQNLESNPSMSAIGEFNVETSNFSAAYGTAGAAVVNVSLKSGTNQFHGEAYEWFRNNALNARNFFSAITPPQKRNEFGATLGGPIKRDKLFFFYSEEFRRGIDSENILTHTPTAAELAGNFAQAPLENGATTLKDPTGRGCATGTQILATCIDPNAIALLGSGLFPSPNYGNASSFTNYNVFPSYDSNFHQELLRMDYNLSSKTTLMGHFIHEGYNVLNPRTDSGSQSFPTLGSIDAYPDQNSLFRVTHTFSPTLLSVTDLGYSRWNQDGTLSGLYARPSGFTVTRLFPSSTNALNRVPTVDFSQGYGQIDPGSYPRDEAIQTFHAQQNFTYVRGRQTLEFGGLWQESRTLKQVTITPGTEGAFNFSGVFTNNALADFLLGYAATYSELSAQLESDLRQKVVAAFLQDDFRVSRRLTLNFGLRYSIMPHAFDAGNLASNFEPSSWNPSAAPQVNSSGHIVPGTGSLANGIVVAGQGVPRNFANTSWTDLGPRVGFAFDPTGTQRLVIRGGYGIFYWNTPEDDSLNMITNPPFAQVATLQNITFSNPTAGVTPASSPSSLTARVTDYKVPMTQEYSLGIQRQMWGGILLDVSYVGSESTHLMGYVDLNAPLPAAGYDFNPALNANALEVLYRPYQGWGQIGEAIFDRNSNYNALQLSLRRRVQGNYYFGVSYTYGKSLDDGSGGQYSQSSYNVRGDWGPSDYDQRQVYKTYFVAHLPLFRNNRAVAGKMLGGWTFSGIVTAYTGIAKNISLTGSGNGLATRPNITGPIDYDKTFTSWITANYSKPQPGFYGDASRNAVYGPGLQEWDLSLLKSFAISERIRTQLRLDAFNAFNHTNFSSFSSAFGSGNFGAITAAATPRNLQLGLQIFF